MDPSVSLCVRIERVQKESETTFKNISLFFLLGCIKAITRLQALCMQHVTLQDLQTRGAKEALRRSYN